MDPSLLSRAFDKPIWSLVAILVDFSLHPNQNPRSRLNSGIMRCSCRTASLRTFVQGLSQVHKVETPSPSFLRFRSPVARSTLYPNQLATVQQARQFYAARSLGQDTAEAVPPSNSKAETSNQNKNASSWGRGDEVQKVQLKERERYTTGRASRAGNADMLDIESSETPRRGRRPKPFTSDTDHQVGSTGKWSKRDAPRPWVPRATRAANDPILEPPPSEPKPKKPFWAIQKEALKQKFPEGWNPRKRLSPDALAGIRALNAQFPEVYTTEALAKKFEVSPENIRRILRSKWAPSVDEEENRSERWHRRGKQIWEQKAALGVKPPRKWRSEGITRDPSYHAWRREASRKNKEWEQNEDREYRASLQSRVSGKVL